MTRPTEKSRRKRHSNPGSSSFEADALTTRPTRRFEWQKPSLSENSASRHLTFHESVNGLILPITCNSPVDKEEAWMAVNRCRLSRKRSCRSENGKGRTDVCFQAFWTEVNDLPHVTLRVNPVGRKLHCLIYARFIDLSFLCACESLTCIIWFTAKRWPRSGGPPQWDTTTKATSPFHRVHLLRHVMSHCVCVPLSRWFTVYFQLHIIYTLSIWSWRLFTLCQNMFRLVSDV